jgi:capsule polysaccharide export protein KpsE/RkpR
LPKDPSSTGRERGDLETNKEKAKKKKKKKKKKKTKKKRDNMFICIIFFTLFSPDIYVFSDLSVNREISIQINEICRAIITQVNFSYYGV